MEISKLFYIAAFVMLLFTLSVNYAIAAEITYEPNGIVVRNNPTVCSLQPLDTDLTNNQLEKFSTQTRSSVAEWEQHLKEKAGKSNWPNWEINHKHFDSNKLTSESLLDCDIVVVFSPTPQVLISGAFWD